MGGFDNREDRYAGIRKRVLGFGEFSLQKSYYPELQSRIQELEKAVEEKTVLLKEVHHRVKNNLQVISSLLDMQMHISVNTDPVEMLKAARGRVHAMGLVHEKLYQSSGLTDISIADYFSELVSMLRSAYGRPGLRIDLKVADHKINVDVAVPCGLILNELVTNALKYAYPDDVSGSISIAVMIRDGNCILLVADDGKGFDTAVETTGLGRRLVEILVGQLKGTMKYLSGTGTRVEIVFPISMS